MNVYRDSFFRIFQPDIRGGLQRFFESRNASITPALAGELIGANTLDKLIGLQLVENDAGDCRLDDRVERFLDEMLGAGEVAQADWLVSLLEELRRLIHGYQQLTDAAKGDALLRRIHRLMRTCHSRVQRHVEDIKTSVDYDYDTNRQEYRVLSAINYLFAFADRIEIEGEGGEPETTDAQA